MLLFLLALETKTATNYPQYTVYEKLIFGTGLKIVANSFPAIYCIMSTEKGSLTLTKKYDNGTNIDVDISSDVTPNIFVKDCKSELLFSSSVFVSKSCAIAYMCGYTGCEHGLYLFTTANSFLDISGNVPGNIPYIWPNQNRCFFFANQLSSCVTNLTYPDDVIVDYMTSSTKQYTTLNRGVTDLKASAINVVISVKYPDNDNWRKEGSLVVTTTVKTDGEGFDEQFEEIPRRTPFQTPFATLFDTPYQTPFQTLYNTPHKTLFNTPFQTLFDSPYQTPFQTLYKTLYDTPMYTVHATMARSPFRTIEYTPFITGTLLPTLKETVTATFKPTVLPPTPAQSPKETPARTPIRTMYPSQSPFFDEFEGEPYDPNPIVVEIKETNPPLQTEYVKTEVPTVKTVAVATLGTVIAGIIVSIAVINIFRTFRTLHNPMVEPEAAFDDVYELSDSFLGKGDSVSETSSFSD